MTPYRAFLAVVCFFLRAGAFFLAGRFLGRLTWALASPSTGYWGIGGVVGNGSKPSGSPWLIGNDVGIVPVARP